jgi:hypothetical protein
MSARFFLAGRGFRGWFLLGLAALIGSAQFCRAQTAAVAQPRVAMLDFTSDDGLMRSAAGAAQWSALTQNALSALEPDVVWIERSQLQLAADELHLSVAGFASADSSLQVGKWLKADLAISGRFLRNAKNDDGHTLRLTVIDLNRADTLATRTVQIAGDRRDAIVPDQALVSATSSALHDALMEARSNLASQAHQRVIAPLFFRNADPSPRLNHFESDLMAAITDAAAHAAGVRLLRFPQADAARDEADLAVRGLAESDPNAWQHVADLYVWGSYRELPAAGAAFAQTPVEIELTLWDGVTPPAQLTEKTTVAGLPVMAQRLAARCLDAARQNPAVRPPAVAARDEIARSLRQQSERLESTLASYGTARAAFSGTPEGQALLRRERLVAEAACFFTPGDRDAQLARLRARWTGFPSPVENLPLLELWQRANDLADFAERFGNRPVDGPYHDLAQDRVDADAWLVQRLKYGENDIHLPGSEANLPIDATDSDIAAWNTSLDARFALAYAHSARASSTAEPRVLHSPCSFWMRTALQSTRDPAAAAAVVEALWPLYKPYYLRDRADEDRQFGVSNGGFAPMVALLYSRLHQPERAAAIVGSLSAPEPASATLNAPAASLPTLAPVLRTLRFPQPPESTAAINPKPAAQWTIHNLTLSGDDLLWMCAQREQDLWNGQPPAETQQLWRFDPADDSLAAVPVTGLSATTPITSIVAQPGGLWLTVDLTGVWSYDPDLEQVTHRYTTADGVNTPNMDRGIATPNGALLFAGHDNGRPLLNRFDPASRQWSRIDLASGARQIAIDAAPPLTPGAPHTEMAAYDHWLLVGLANTWLVVDTVTHRVEDLRDVLPGKLGITSFVSMSVPTRRARHCAAGAAHGFWLAVEGKVVEFDPAHPAAAKCWPMPSELPFGIDALAADGNDLWVAGPCGVRREPQTGTAGAPAPGLIRNGRGLIAIFDGADGKWRGGFEISGYVTCLAIARQTVFAGLDQTAEPVLEIEKAATLARAAR